MRVGTSSIRHPRYRRRLVGVIALAFVGVTSGESFAAGVTPGSTSKTAGIMSCAQAVVVKPSSFVISCADGNSYLQKIKWGKWTSTSANATATYTENNCTPYCAAGKFINYTAKVTLSAVRSTKSGKLFTKLYVAYRAGNKTKSFNFALLT